MDIANRANIARSARPHGAGSSPSACCREEKRRPLRTGRMDVKARHGQKQKERAAFKRIMTAGLAGGLAKPQGHDTGSAHAL